MEHRSTILIVDDDSRNIFAMNAVLRTRGYQCLAVTTAAEAFGLLSGNNGIDIVLLDMMMPDMDGYEALRRLKHSESTSRLPVVAVTAQAMKGDREKCLEAGADDYVSKPVDIDELERVIKRLLK